MPREESKKDAFKRVAKSRTRRVLKELELLGNCGNRHNYEYDEDQVAKIFSAIEANFRETKNKFCLHRSSEFDF